MAYPPFYDNVPQIILKDPLADFLGSFEDGIIKIKYINIVKHAGHSCPTVAGAYLITLEALKVLYPDSIPIRGAIKVAFKESIEDGTIGVISNVITNITGATGTTGFKGLSGKFSRHSLMDFNAPISASARFTRIDTNQNVDISYNPARVPPSPWIQPLMQKIMQGVATAEEKKEFGQLWQARVEEILLNYKSHPGLLELKTV